MQNRVGLRNPGARAAAEYLARHADALPATWGLNLAVSPGVTDPSSSSTEIAESAAFFEEAFAGHQHGPRWLTLNLSCPNTDDDPRGTQSAELAAALRVVLTVILRQLSSGSDAAPSNGRSAAPTQVRNGAAPSRSA